MTAYLKAVQVKSCPVACVFKLKLNDMDIKYVPAVKGGRCFNGCHKDGGVIVHLAPAMPENASGYWSGKALCGTEPGLRGYGWSDTTKEVNCEKCLKRNKKLTTTQTQ